jgi:Tol biopolymer transport system component
MSGKRRLLVILCSVLLLAAFILTAAWVLSRRMGVRVTRFVPEDGADNVPITAPIRISFSQEMDKASVAERFHIEPETMSSLAWEGSDVMFVPHSAFSTTRAYTITLAAGATSARGRQIDEDLSWRFQTRAPLLLYMARAGVDAGLRQIYVTDELGSTARQVTDHPWGVWDYGVHPHGEAVVYSVLREDGGADLWRMGRDGSDQEMMLACPETACVSPTWSSDGKQIAYERRDIRAESPNLDPKAGRLWLLDVEEGDTKPLFEYDVPTHSAAWAPDGKRIAYASPLLPGVEIYHLETGKLRQFGNQWGARPEWSPDGTRLVLPELVMIGEEFVVRLVVADVDGEHAIDISGDDDLVKDDSPAWSPGGGWIAHGHQFLDDERWTPGREIWLTRPDGSEAYPLVAKPMGDLFSPAWRADGAALAYLHLDLSEGPQAVPDVSVWVIDLANRKAIQVADQGVLPAWLP